jgi:hypothetical protein
MYKYMESLRSSVQSLQSLFPRHVASTAFIVPPQKLEGLPVWIKSTVKLFQLPMRGVHDEPFLYLAIPEQGVAFEHLLRIYRQLTEKFKAPVLIVADTISPKHRPLLVKFNIAFIYKNESIYAPELGLKFDRLKRFQENPKIRVDEKSDALSPFALKLLAGLLTNQVPREFTLKMLHKKIQDAGFDISNTKLSIALNELVGHDLLLAGGAGPTRHFANAAAEKTWKKILMMPLSPFFREAETNYVPKNRENFCFAGETALANYSNLATGSKTVIAMSVKEFRQIYDGKHAVRSDEASFGGVYTASMIEIWKEPPHLFAIRGNMNPVEVFFSLRNHHDERVQLALDEMLLPYGLRKEEH